MGWRVQYALLSRLSRAPDPRQYPEKRDLIRADFLNRFETPLVRGVHEDRMKFLELISRHILIQFRLLCLNLRLTNRQGLAYQEERNSTPQHQQAVPTADNAEKRRRFKERNNSEGRRGETGIHDDCPDQIHRVESRTGHPLEEFAEALGL